MAVIPAAVRRLVASARVAHLGTQGERLGLVPVCFVLLGETAYQAIDAKPKSRNGRLLRRVANIRGGGEVVLLVDHYEEDWRRLWYVLLRGKARLVEGGPEQRRAITALRRKYVQYRTSTPLGGDSLVIALDVARLWHWQASSPGRAPATRRAAPG